MVTPLPFTLGPSDDWDPQGYEEEAEDALVPGMHILDDDEEDDEKDDDIDDPETVELSDDDDDEEDDEEEDQEYVFENKSAIEELDELEDIVLKSERETLRLSDFVEED